MSNSSDYSLGVASSQSVGEADMYLEDFRAQLDELAGRPVHPSGEWFDALDDIHIQPINWPAEPISRTIEDYVSRIAASLQAP